MATSFPGVDGESGTLGTLGPGWVPSPPPPPPQPPKSAKERSTKITRWRKRPRLIPFTTNASFSVRFDVRRIPSVPADVFSAGARSACRFIILYGEAGGCGNQTARLPGLTRGAPSRQSGHSDSCHFRASMVCSSRFAIVR